MEIYYEACMSGHVGLLTEITVGWLHSGVPEPENATVRRKMKCVCESGGGYN